MGPRTVVEVQQEIRVTNHAADNYCIFYPLRVRVESPEDLRERVRVAVRAGEEINPDVAQRLCGRMGDSRNSRYVLHAERTGLFVLVDNVVVTFLRFYSTRQHRLAVSLYGPGAPISNQAVPYYDEVMAPEPPAPAPAPAPPASPKEPLFWGIPAREVTFSTPAARALGGREEARTKLGDIEKGYLTMTGDGSPIRVLTKKGGGVHIILDTTQEPQNRKGWIPQIASDMGDLRVSPALFTGRSDRWKLRNKIAGGIWQYEDKGKWKVTTAEGSYFVIDRGDGWYVCLTSCAPIPPEEEALARVLREKGWKVIAPWPEEEKDENEEDE